jgi:hypothetical protein
MRSLPGALALALVGGTMAVVGCARFPQTPQETREYIPGSLMGKVQTFEVDRPLSDVSRDFRARAPECLNVSTQTVEQGAGSHSNVLSTYRPTVVVNAQRTELYLQEHMQGSVLVPGKEPEGGFYAVITDATPVSPNRTKVVIYSASRAFDVVVKAIAGWADGSNAGCPDMTRRMSP